MIGNVKRPSVMRPLLSIQETKMKQGMGKKSRSIPKKTYDETQPHSSYSAARSRSYQKSVDRMNPTKTLPARRLFPGLPN
jgi:hypothetical protein